MSQIPPVRVVVTHDFCCSYLPSPTSYGSLPGGEGLARTLNRLREEGPTVWADAGDFAAPGALAVHSSGKGGFEAAADLDIDVGAVGNHEFDWGVEHLRSQAHKTGYPLLCANCPETGLPATAMIPTEAGDVGFVGLTCPHPEAYASAPPLDPDLAGVVVRHAGELRASGAQWVVALIHDGVGWSIGSRGYVADPERFAALCRPWAWSVDAIVGTHTLGRWIGSVERTPVVQPWPLGAELGVVEFARGGKARAYGITRDWWPMDRGRQRAARRGLIRGTRHAGRSPACQIGRAVTAGGLLRQGAARSSGHRRGRGGHGRRATTHGWGARLPASRPRHRGRPRARLPLARDHRGRRTGRGGGPGGGALCVA